jgi:iron complex outermembrane receptor protein
MRKRLLFGLVLAVAGLVPPFGRAQTPPGASATRGSIRGTVTLSDQGAPLHHATIVVLPSGRTADTDAQGQYRIDNLAPGTYRVMAHMHALSDADKTVQVLAGGEAAADFALRLAPMHEAVTVTASGDEVAVQESFHSVLSKEAYELNLKQASPSLGDLLQNESGVAKRSGGPGTGRPVIRGFDGDRVLVMQDGMRTGTLSSQSGDHGEPVDVNTIERVEVVKGPATLLYGSNAIGGVVNVLTVHHLLHQHPHEGLRGSLSATGGTANAMGGGSGSFEYGHKNWLVFGSGGGTRTSDYATPIGTVQNSGSRMEQGMGGLGHFGAKLAWNAMYGKQQGLYEVPFNPDDPGEGRVSLDWQRQYARFNTTVKGLGPYLDRFQLETGFTDWTHKEMANGEADTEFFNKQFVYRGTFSQTRRGHWSGTFGFWGLARDFKAIGEEALAPPVTQNAFAVFGLEEFSFEKVRLQFGTRLEHNGYTPVGLEKRGFTGASASGGVFLPAWKDGALVVNYMHSYRAPALEELYNHGPHPGNAIFEIGNPNLKREAADGVEMSVRHNGKRIHFETNLYRYQMHDFVYFNPTGTREEGLPVAIYDQADTRYLGAESRLETALRPNLWLQLGFDAVDANLTASRINLPRIPPARGRVGIDYTWKGLTVRPELILTNRQWQVAPNETPTAGFGLLNLNATYSWATRHVLHTFSLECFNLSDQLYRNHLSFIKSYAPEIGRGVRFGYTVHWF